MIKKKKLIFIIITIPLMLLTIGCNIFSKEDKQFNALKTEAVYSSFGYPGFSRDAINVIEIDKNGRIIYEFYGQNFANYYGITHILICQYIDYENNLVYYYPENNFTIHLINEDASYEQLDQLKTLNDWNKEIDLSRCISKKIGENKQTNDEPEISKIFDSLNYNITMQYKKIVLCDIDKNGLKLYAVKIAEDEQNYQIFAFILKNNTYTNYDIIELSNWYYIDEIKAFKIKHNWTYL